MTKLTALTQKWINDLRRSNLPEALWPVDCDANQIRQVITQLVLNAREAMPDGV